MTLKVLEMNIDRIQEGKHFRMLKSWEGAERKGAEVKYDKARHMSFETAKLYHESVGDILVITVKILGSHRMISLQCYADGKDTENFLGLIKRVVYSFKYERGYGFGESKGVAPGWSQKLLGNTWQSWLLWIVGVIVVSWLIRRWVQG